MWNSTNPAELYPGTTWYLIPDNKFIKTGSTPSQYAGSNSISISKANLPAEKLQVESFNLTRGTMDITGNVGIIDDDNVSSGAFYENGSAPTSCYNFQNRPHIFFQASRAWTGSTSSASPYTSAMGSGTPLTINPEHITVKAWERLT